MLEENFITSMIKSNGDLGAFLARPIALGLAMVCLLVWTWPLVAKLLLKSGKTQTA
jgi:TctA family transporter